jgi:hypothetical protein
MSVATVEGIIENGQVRLPPNIHLPERAKVFVVIPGIVQPTVTPYIGSPRLVHPEQAADFVKRVVEERS